MHPPPPGNCTPWWGRERGRENNNLRRLSCCVSTSCPLLCYRSICVCVCICVCVLCVCEREIEREKYSGTRGRLKLWFAPACPWLVHMLFVSCMYVTFFLIVLCVLVLFKGFSRSCFWSSSSSWFMLRAWFLRGFCSGGGIFRSESILLRSCILRSILLLLVFCCCLYYRARTAPYLFLQVPGTPFFVYWHIITYIQVQ